VARRCFFFSPDALREQRKAQHLTQEALSRAVGMNPTIAMFWENSKYEPRLDTFFRIVTVLDCEIEDLLISVDTDDEAPRGDLDDDVRPSALNTPMRGARGAS